MSGNSGHELLHLQTNAVVIRQRCTAMPLTPAVIKQVHMIAKKEGMPSGLKIKNRAGNILFDSTWTAGVQYDEDLFLNANYSPSDLDESDDNSSDSNSDDTDEADSINSDKIDNLVQDAPAEDTPPTARLDPPEEENMDSHSNDGGVISQEAEEEQQNNLPEWDE
eukprot:4051025-Ditylum_brightwellii.AAC.2